jgi:hypothetical protein
MEYKKLLLAISLISILLVGCASAEAPAPMYEESYDGEMPAVEKVVANDAGGRSSSSWDEFTDESTQIEPLVIRNANLSLVVDDPAESAEEIASMAESMGGYVVNSNIYQTTYGSSQIPTTRAYLLIRVPVERLDEALDKIVEDAIEVSERNVTGEDVTQEYTDLESRLRNLEAAEEQLREIMDSTTKTEDVLMVFNDLRQVREEIEVIKGQMNYYEDSARLSAISIDLIPDVLAQPIQIGGWRPEGTAKDALETLVKTLQFLADFGIWLVICVLPIILIFGIPGFFVIRSILRRRRAKKAALQTEVKE